MARSRSRRPFVVPLPDAQSGLRHVLLRTIPGRLVVGGVAVRLVLVVLAAAAGPLPPAFGVLDTTAGIAIAVGAAYFVVRLFIAAKRRLLWRVRRKLILSYIFVGFIPAILIVAFFLLVGLLLFNNLSTYLVQSRLRALSDEAKFLAQSTALEIQRGGGRDVSGILARRQASAVAQFPGVSLAVVPYDGECADDGASTSTAPPDGRADPRPVTVGPWAHLRPPRTLPAWIHCAGFGGVLAYAHPTERGEDEVHLVVRGVAFPESPRPGYALVVDVPVNGDIRQRLRQTTGVDLQHLTPVDPKRAKPLEGSAAADTPLPAADGSNATARNSVTALEFTDWSTGEPALLTARILLNIGDIYERISGTKGQGGAQTVGQRLLFILGVIGVLFLVIEFLALIAGLALAKSITGSIHALFTGTERVRQGDFTHKIPVMNDDQLGELTDSFNSMTASIEDLLRQAAEKKRLEEELRIAHEIQMSLLPQGPLQMRGVSVTALCVPAREVGGDYYDFVVLDDRRFGVLIADVSGKGTSAALYMAELKGLILSLGRIHRSPRELLIAANEIIAEHLDARSFITMTYAMIDLEARTMTYARAGHTPLIYLPGDEACADRDRHVRILAPDGLVLGLKIDKGEMFEKLLEEQTIPLHTGDLYVFFTDGITEAMNESDDCFGEQRLGRLVEEHADLPSVELRERVLREIEAFVGTAPQHDDMTMILLKIDALDANADERAGTAVGSLLIAES
jgi:sigma-B regulation protein RsbU (phosphoserine phosphatase)